MARLTRKLLILLMLLVAGSHAAIADRLKDLTSIAGVRSNQLVGYGVVVGLAGTGDGSSGLTLQSLQSMVSQFGLVTDAANLTAKNAAAVMVTAELPPFMKPGQRLDITVSTVGGGQIAAWWDSSDDTNAWCRWRNLCHCTRQPCGWWSWCHR